MRHCAPYKEDALPQWVSTGQFTADTATPGEANAWLTNELNQ